MMKTRSKQFKVYSVIAVLFAILCGSLLYVFILRQPGYSYRIPIQTDDGWDTASLAAVDMNENLMITAMNTLLKLEENPLHGILIVKNGKLVFEEYFSGEDLDATDGLRFVHKDFDRDTLHCAASVSKSITSILVGIAVEQGKFSIQDSLFSQFPEYATLSSPEKETITLQHVLTMSSGIPWDESLAYTNPKNDLGNMLFQSDDPVGYVLEKSLVTKPGSSFIYNSGTTNLLGEVVRKSMGSTLLEFAKEHLFTPLSVSLYDWGTFPNDPQMAVASSLLYLRPRDMAKIGQLYLQKGIWNETRIVSEQWVAESTKHSMDVPSASNPMPELVESYGYQWWRGTFPNGEIETYFAAGWGGQFIFVLPELEMVIVVTAGNYEGNNTGFYELVNTYILAAVNGAK